MIPRMLYCNVLPPDWSSATSIKMKYCCRCRKSSARFIAKLHFHHPLAKSRADTQNEVHGKVLANFRGQIHRSISQALNVIGCMWVQFVRLQTEGELVDQFFFIRFGKLLLENNEVFTLFKQQLMTTKQKNKGQNFGLVQLEDATRFLSLRKKISNSKYLLQTNKTITVPIFDQSTGRPFTTLNESSIRQATAYTAPLCISVRFIARNKLLSVLSSIFCKETGELHGARRQVLDHLHGVRYIFAYNANHRTLESKRRNKCCLEREGNNQSYSLLEVIGFPPSPNETTSNPVWTLATIVNSEHPVGEEDWQKDHQARNVRKSPRKALNFIINALCESVAVLTKWAQRASAKMLIRSIAVKDLPGRSSERCFNCQSCHDMHALETTPTFYWCWSCSILPGFCQSELNVRSHCLELALM